MSDEDDNFWRAINADLDSRKRRSQEIIAAYESGDRAGVRAAAVIEYRCHEAPRGCLLLHVWKAAGDLLFYQPPYKLSPGRNAEQSNAAGRAANTRDGDRRWKASAGVLDDLRGWGPQAGLALQCDHVSLTVPSDDLLAVADAATPGKPARRAL